MSPTPQWSSARVDVELADLDRRFALAVVDGPSAATCAELTADYRTLIDHGAGDPRPELGLALVAEACGSPDEAEAIYAALARRDHGPAWTNLGALAWQRGQLDAAIDAFARAVELDRRTAVTARNNLSAALFERYRRAHAEADFDAAERAAQQALAIDSANVWAYENLARLYYERGHAREPSYLLLAELALTQGSRVAEREGLASAELHNLRGLLWLAEAEPSRALRSFEAAIEIDPGHVDAHRNLALLALCFRGFAEAERSLTAIVTDPAAAEDVEVWLGLGVARRGLGDLDGAAAAYRRAAELAPDDPRPWFDLGVLAQDHRPWTSESQAEIDALNREASQEFERAIELARDWPGWAPAADEVRDRLAVAQDSLALSAEMRVPGPVLERLTELEQAQEAERRHKLLEMERQAAAAAGPPPAESSSRPHPSDEEIQRRLDLEREGTVAPAPAHPPPNL